MNRAVAVARLRIVVVCLGVLGLAGEAWADWAVVTVGGDGANRATRDFVRGRAEARLRAAEYNTLDKGSAVQVGVTDDAIARCVRDGDACVKKALAAAEVDRLVHVELVAVSPGYQVTARMYDGIKGTLLGKDELRCVECTAKGGDALGRVVEELVAKLLDDKDAGGPVISGPDTWLEVTTDPPGATITIDGKAVGPSGRAYGVTAGEHRVRVELHGHDAAEKTVSAVASETTRVSIALSKHVDTPREPRRFGAWKWVALGTGVGLTAIGVGGFVIDGDARYDDNGALLPEKWDTTARASVFTSVGVIALGLSAYFIYHDATVPEGALPEAAAPERARGVTVHRMGDGWGVGMTGTF